MSTKEVGQIQSSEITPRGNLHVILQYDAEWTSAPNSLLRDDAGQWFLANTNRDDKPTSELSAVTLTEAMSWFVECERFGAGVTTGTIATVMKEALLALQTEGLTGRRSTQEIREESESAGYKSAAIRAKAYEAFNELNACCRESGAKMKAISMVIADIVDNDLDEGKRLAVGELGCELGNLGPLLWKLSGDLDEAL